ncbi:MAG: hypothetical protein ACI4BH_09225, partial [Muribaculaceae bacterium]
FLFLAISFANFVLQLKIAIFAKQRQQHRNPVFYPLNYGRRIEFASAKLTKNSEKPVQCRK